MCSRVCASDTLEQKLQIFIVLSKINQHGEGCPGQQRAMKEVLAECWGHPLPLIDQPNPERIFLDVQKDFGGKEKEKNNRERNTCREIVSALGSRYNIVAQLEDYSLWFVSLNLSAL